MTGLTDQLVYDYEVAQSQKNYTLCDSIRNELDSRGSFIYGSYKEGVQVYHMGKGYTREFVNKEKWFYDETWKGR